MKLSKLIIISAALSLTHIHGAHAAPAGVVEGLQMPAWLERGTTRLPLKPGMDLQSGDKVITGNKAKVLLRLEEGSNIKLGENARINLKKLEPPKQKSGLFSGFLNVVKGAFRFTTSKIGQSRKRSVDIKIGTFTAGIRGTDIWGRSNDEKDLVCLIEGKINVNSEGKDITMSDPLTFFVKPKNAPADPVGPVDKVQLGQWALETELKDGAGVVRQGGNYFVNLMSVGSQQLADVNAGRFHQAGYAVDIQNVMIDGIQWYRLRISGLASRADADQLAQNIRTQFDIQSTWIDKT